MLLILLVVHLENVVASAIRIFVIHAVLAMENAIVIVFLTIPVTIVRGAVNLGRNCRYDFSKSTNLFNTHFFTMAYTASRLMGFEM